jgi:AraC-like DNA-binding protein
MLLQFFYLAACDLEKVKSEENLKSNQHILKRFEDLIEKHFSEWHQPQVYANELSITANYLNAKCKSSSGKTAGQWIRARLILEAKRLLVNSELSISEISYQLNFEDNSYFTKFFKSGTGISPSDFRQNLNK